jgi:hypothetical protein
MYVLRHVHPRTVRNGFSKVRTLHVSNPPRLALATAAASSATPVVRGVCPQLPASTWHIGAINLLVRKWSCLSAPGVRPWVVPGWAWGHHSSLREGRAAEATGRHRTTTQRRDVCVCCATLFSVSQAGASLSSPCVPSVPGTTARWVLTVATRWLPAARTRRPRPAAPRATTAACIDSRRPSLTPPSPHRAAWHSVTRAHPPRPPAPRRVTRRM